MYRIILLSSLLIITSNIILFSQSEDDWFILPDGLGFQNHLEYSFNVESKKEIFENWTNLDYMKGVFSAGIRFEAFQPNDPDPSINRGKIRYSDIAYKYISVDLGDFDKGVRLTAGNFYTLFGRGMILKSYEDRNIRIDNNLIGFKAEAHFYDFYLTALSGSAANSQNIRKDVLHAIDLSYRGLNFLKAGITHAANLPEDESLSKTSLTSLRLEPSIWNLDFYFELAIKQNNDIEKNVFEDKESIVGKGFYGNANMYLGPFAFTGEYKIYDNFAFTSNDGTIFYNTPPSLRKEYTYQLLNRHPSPLDQSNEQGYQIEINYTLDEETTFQTSYGLTQTLPASSYFQRINRFNLPIVTQFKEFFAQAYHSWNENLNTTLSFGYNEELSSNTKNITPILENKFYFDDINTIKLIIEHQHTTNRITSEKYYSDVLSIEYLRSPSFNVGWVTEVQTKKPETDRIVRKVWSFVQFGYKISSHTDLSLLFGSRQAGNICIGGVCRFEPEFRGIEFKMLTRL
ncbi:MAG: DUF6029 family protein [Ignavibacterium sp.]|nr:DUF6029 family protein [Ignavibacterium sp.]